MRRGALMLAALAMTALTSCGSSTTKTVTTVVTPSTSTATTPSATTQSVTTQPTTSTATSVTTSVTATTQGVVYFQGVSPRGAQRPSSLELTGDGTLFVQNVQWTSWGGPVATGSGNAEYHGCTPNCASAPVHTALVAIRLFGVRTCAGRNYYSGVTLRLNSGALLDKDFLQRSWSPC